MQIAYVVFLVLNLLLEVFAAVSLITGPDGLSAAGRGEMWSMHYGFAALAIASGSLWAWPQRRNAGAVTLALGVLLTFHTGLVVSLAVAGDQQGGLIAHCVLALFALVLFVLRGKVSQ
jgi:hypothetical protein